MLPCSLWSWRFFSRYVPWSFHGSVWMRSSSCFCQCETSFEWLAELDFWTSPNYPRSMFRSQNLLIIKVIILEISVLVDMITMWLCHSFPLSPFLFPAATHSHPQASALLSVAVPVCLYLSSLSHPPDALRLPYIPLLTCSHFPEQLFSHLTCLFVCLLVFIFVFCLFVLVTGLRYNAVPDFLPVPLAFFPVLDCFLRIGPCLPQYSASFVPLVLINKSLNCICSTRVCIWVHLVYSCDPRLHALGFVIMSRTHMHHFLWIPNAIWVCNLNSLSMKSHLWPWVKWMCESKLKITQFSILMKVVRCGWKLQKKSKLVDLEVKIKPAGKAYVASHNGICYTENPITKC